MRRAVSTIFLVMFLSIASGDLIAGGRFELLSRTLLQAHTTDVIFFDRGMIVASGAALAIASPRDSLSNHRLLPLGGEIRDLDLHERYAYASVWNSGLVTIDLTDPANPVQSAITAIEQPSRITVDSGRLTVSVSGEELYLFSLSDPSKPRLTGRFGIDKGALSLDSAGDIIAVFYEEKTILFDIDHNRPIALAPDPIRIESPWSSGRGYINDSTLYILGSDGVTRRYDITDCRFPEKISDMPIKKILSIGFGDREGIVLTGEGRLVPFSISGEKIKKGKPLTADISDGPDLPGMKPDLLPRLKGKKISHTVPGNDLAVSDGDLAIFGLKDGVYLFRLDAEVMYPVSRIPSGGFAFDLVARDGWLFLANGQDGLRTGKVDAEGQIEWKGHLESPQSRDVALAGDLLILASGNEGMKIIDITNPAAPAQVGIHASPYFLSAVVTQGSLAILAGGLGGAEIVDFSEPESPKLVWREKFSEVRGVFADTDYIYISDGFEGFHTYRIDGGTVTYISGFNTPGWNDDLFVNGDMVYLAEGGKGLYIADISDRRKPRMLGSVDIGSIAREIHARGRTVFVASQKKGITAIDISDPGNPFIVARHRSADDARGVFADENFVYLASGAGGVYIFRYIER
ncbi:MAG: hypothetical protein JW814_06150 [Candidatus Krumholzibacteriota bacterium]|nr:hypothetical protein [Candidatus Krumholzibacteriota bacterium]